MSAYKKLNKQDAYITTYVAHKTWNIRQEDFESYGITEHRATDLYLNSLQQLYYPPKEGGLVSSHSIDTYQQTTLNFPESRNLATGSYILSIPRSLYGTAIVPNSVEIERYIDFYVDENYWEGYTREIRRRATPIKDDSEGNLFIPADLNFGTYDEPYEWKIGYSELLGDATPRLDAGDVIYTHGMIILTNKYLFDIENDVPRVVRVSFKSTHPIYTHNYHCRVKDYEFNFTHNPSATLQSTKVTYDNNGDIYNSTAQVNTGELNTSIAVPEFQPYITTIGLYNDANELIAVGKLSQPVPKSANTDMTFIVKIDI